MNFIQKTFNLYKNAYSGLPRNVWYLSIIALINRSGTMIVPFMSVYFTKELHFSLDQTANLLLIFGVGSTLGSQISGKLVDKIGAFRVQWTSLIFGGLMFFAMMFIKKYEAVLFAIFFLGVISDSFRPANSASVALYSSPEIRSRAYALNRLSLNLGFAIGPTLGGFLAFYSYDWLFVVDGVTCVLAGVVFIVLFRKMPRIIAQKPTETVVLGSDSPYKDRIFMIFLFFSTINAICFFQLFTSLPLYVKQYYRVGEEYLGILIASNGIFIALFEMVIVYRLEGKFNLLKTMSFGAFLVSISFIAINFVSVYFFILFAVIIMTLGEIFTMPMMNVFVVNRSPVHRRGEYIGLYTAVYSLAHIFAPLVGLKTAAIFGFETLWQVIFAMALFTSLGFWWLSRQKDLR